MVKWGAETARQSLELGGAERLVAKEEHAHVRAAARAARGLGFRRPQGHQADSPLT